MLILVQAFLCVKMCFHFLWVKFQKINCCVTRQVYVKLWKNCQNDFERNCTFVYFHQNCMRILVVLYRRQHVVLLILAILAILADVSCSFNMYLLTIWNIEYFFHVQCLFGSFVHFKIRLSNQYCLLNSVHILWIEILCLIYILGLP